MTARRVAGVLVALLAMSWTGVAGAGTRSEHAPASSQSFETTTELPDSLPGYRIYRPADLDATGERLPVIVWANGACVRIEAVWAPVLERWAEAGFFVIAITTPPPDGNQDPTTPADQAAAIDWAVEQNKRGADPYAGHLDVKRVVAAGNSCGGITSLALAGQDDRVKAVFVLSGSSVGPGAPREEAAAIMRNVKVPVGFTVGGTEDVARSQADQDFEVLPKGVPGYVAHRSAGDHTTMSIDPAILQEVSDISIRWIDLALYGTKSAKRELLKNPCPSCPSDMWTVTAKHLDDLVTS